MTKMEKLMAAVTFLCVPFWTAAVCASFFWRASFACLGTIIAYAGFCYFVWRSVQIVRTGNVPFVYVDSRRKVLLSQLAAAFWLVSVVLSVGALEWFEPVKAGEIVFAVSTNTTILLPYVTAAYFVCLSVLRRRSFRRRAMRSA